MCGQIRRKLTLEGGVDTKSCGEQWLLIQEENRRVLTIKIFLNYLREIWKPDGN